MKKDLVSGEAQFRPIPLAIQPATRRAKPDIDDVFARLRAVMRRARALDNVGYRVAEDGARSFLVLGAPTRRYPAGMMFGAVARDKAYGGYHLMAVYANRALMRGFSPALRARMHGKSCFNFRALDAALLGGIDRLPGRSLAFFRPSPLCFAIRRRGDNAAAGAFPPRRR